MSWVSRLFWKQNREETEVNRQRSKNSKVNEVAMICRDVAQAVRHCS